MDFIVFLLCYPIRLCTNGWVEPVEEHEPQELEEHELQELHEEHKLQELNEEYQSAQS
jgi:hypothetical protein